MGHDYIGHNYTGLNYIRHAYTGHNYTGRNYIGRNYAGEAIFDYIYQLNAQGRRGDILFSALSAPFGWSRLPVSDLLDTGAWDGTAHIVMPQNSYGTCNYGL